MRTASGGGEDAHAEVGMTAGSVLGVRGGMRGVLSGCGGAACSMPMVAGTTHLGLARSVDDPVTGAACGARAHGRGGCVVRLALRMWAVSLGQWVGRVLLPDVGRSGVRVGLVGW